MSILNTTPILLLASVIGVVFGSFYNVLIYRLPRDLNVVGPRSFCPACRHTVAWYDNVPVLSWLLLRGRCRRKGAERGRRQRDGEPKDRRHRPIMTQALAENRHRGGLGGARRLAPDRPDILRPWIAPGGCSPNR